MTNALRCDPGCMRVSPDGLPYELSVALRRRAEVGITPEVRPASPGSRPHRHDRGRRARLSPIEQPPSLGIGRLRASACHLGVAAERRSSAWRGQHCAAFESPGGREGLGFRRSWPRRDRVYASPREPRPARAARFPFDHAPRAPDVALTLPQRPAMPRRSLHRGIFLAAGVYNVAWDPVSRGRTGSERGWPIATVATC